MRKFIYNIIEKDENKALISQIYHKVMLAAIVVGIIPLMFRSHNWVFDLIDVVVTILFTIDYFLRWITADYRSGRKVCQRRRSVSWSAQSQVISIILRISLSEKMPFQWSSSPPV